MKPIYRAGLKWCKNRISVGHPALRNNVQYGKKILYLKHWRHGGMSTHSSRSRCGRDIDGVQQFYRMSIPMELLPHLGLVHWLLKTSLSEQLREHLYLYNLFSGRYPLEQVIRSNTQKQHPFCHSAFEDALEKLNLSQEQLGQWNNCFNVGGMLTLCTSRQMCK